MSSITYELNHYIVASVKLEYVNPYVSDIRYYGRNGFLHGSLKTCNNYGNIKNKYFMFGRPSTRSHNVYIMNVQCNIDFLNRINYILKY